MRVYSFFLHTWKYLRYNLILFLPFSQIKSINAQIFYFLIFFPSLQEPLIMFYKREQRRLYIYIYLLNCISRYTCSCIDGCTGINCEQEVSLCDQTQKPLCGVNGRCHGNATDYTCHCNWGYVGPDCTTGNYVGNNFMAKKTSHIERIFIFVFNTDNNIKTINNM